MASPRPQPPFTVKKAKQLLERATTQLGYLGGIASRTGRVEIQEQARSRKILISSARQSLEFTLEKEHGQDDPETLLKSDSLNCYNALQEALGPSR